MQDNIRVGIVSSINYEKGFVQVTYPDRENAVSGELPCFSFFYEMPEVGDKVVVLYMTNSNHEGFVLGKYYHEGNVPVKFGKGLIHKPLHQRGSEIKYQQNEDTFDLKASSITVGGESVTVSGGSVTVSGENTSIKTEGNTMYIEGTNAVIEASNIVLSGENIILNGENIALNGKSIVLQGEKETKVIN